MLLGDLKCRQVGFMRRIVNISRQNTSLLGNQYTQTSWAASSFFFSLQGKLCHDTGIAYETFYISAEIFYSIHLIYLQIWHYQLILKIHGHYFLFFFFFLCLEIAFENVGTCLISFLIACDQMI